MADTSNRFPWAEKTTPEAFKDRLARAGGKLVITRRNGEGDRVRKYRSGVVYCEHGKVRLSKLVWTPFGYEEIESDETDVEKRALEALAQMDRRIALAELDTPRSYLAMLSKRLEEEKAAQEKAGTEEFQTLDILTEKVVASWLREMADAVDDEEVAASSALYDAADQIEAQRHRKP